MLGRLALGVSLVFAILAPGCASVRVLNESGEDVGFEYWTPKHYVLVSRDVAVSGTAGSNALAGKDAAVVPSYSIHFLSLPNLADGKRRVKVKPGIGSAESALALSGGWQLTSATAKLDSKTNETLSAGAGLLGAAAPLLQGTPGGPGIGSELLGKILDTIKSEKALTGPPPAAPSAVLYEVKLSDQKELILEEVKGFSPRFN